MADQKTFSGSKISSVIARQDDGNIQITFTIPFDEIEHAKADVIKEFAKDTEIPGFRKGMAPLDKVKDKIPQSTLIEHSLSHILPKALADSVTENKLQIAIYPKYELIKATDGEAWQIRGITCELPKVELGDYKNIVLGALRASNLWTPDKGKPTDKKEPTHENKEQIVIKSILENIKVNIPQILIEEEANSRLSTLLGRLEKLGLALESYLSSIGKNAEDLRADYAKQAKDAIMIDLILTKISEAENIKIDQKDIDAALNMSQAEQKPKNEEEGEIESRKRLIESILKRRAALDLLINLG
jgi:FKBP-type peptidyl-prolyl cis-trans isomerase (trigger factor)